MKRISTTSLSVCAIWGMFSFVTACGASEGDRPSADGGTTGSGGSSTAGTSTSGGASSTAGTSSSAGTSSGGSGGTTNGAASVCDADKSGTHLLAIGEALVDDFESESRFEGWYSYAAVAAAGTDIKLARLAGGAAETAMSAGVANSGINSGTDKFGAGVGFNMRDASDACADVSAFDGVSFWAKGSSGTTNKFKFLVVVPAASAVMDGGDCTANCYNHPGKEITLSAEWQQYTVLWSELTGPVPLSENLVLALQWITTGPDYDFSLDEVTLFKGEAPTGPVGGSAGAGGTSG